MSEPLDTSWLPDSEDEEERQLDASLDTSWLPDFTVDSAAERAGLEVKKRRPPEGLGLDTSWIPDFKKQGTPLQAAAEPEAFLPPSAALPTAAPHEIAGPAFSREAFLEGLAGTLSRPAPEDMVLPEPGPPPVASGVQAEAIGDLPAQVAEATGDLPAQVAEARLEPVNPVELALRAGVGGSAQVGSGLAGAGEAMSQAPLLKHQQIAWKVAGDAMEWVQKTMKPDDMEGQRPFNSTVDAIKRIASGDLEPLSDPMAAAPLMYALIENMPTLVAGGAATLASGPAGGFLFMSAMEGGHHYRDLIEQGVPREKAALSAAGVGLVNGMLEYLPVGHLLARLPGVKRSVRAALAQALLQGAEEGSTEPVQEIVGLTSQWLNTGKVPEGALQDVIDSAGLGFLLGLLTGGSVSVASKARDGDATQDDIDALVDEVARAFAADQEKIAQEIDVGAEGVEPPGEIGGEPFAVAGEVAPELETQAAPELETQAGPETSAPEGEETSPPTTQQLPPAAEAPEETAKVERPTPPEGPESPAEPGSTEPEVSKTAPASRAPTFEPEPPEKPAAEPPEKPAAEPPASPRQPPPAPKGASVETAGRPIPESRPRGSQAVGGTPSGRRVSFRWFLVDADDLTHSEMPGYPKDMLQNRDMSRAENQQTVENIAKNPDEFKLAPNPLANLGPPLVTNRGVIISGNHRFLGALRGYEQYNWNTFYREWLKGQAAGVGLDPEAVDGLKRPILVRVLEGDVGNIAAFARELNTGEQQDLADPEQAKSDAALLTPEMLKKINPDEQGNVTRGNSSGFVEAFRDEIVSPGERGAFATDTGDLSTAGQKRIQNALLAKAFGDSEFLKRFLEKAQFARIGDALKRAVPHWLKYKAAADVGEAFSELDLTDDFTKAMARVVQLREKGLNIDDWLKQDDFSGTAPSELEKNIVALLTGGYKVEAKAKPGAKKQKSKTTVRNVIEKEYLEENPDWEPISGSAQRIADVLRRYTDLALEAGDPRQSGLFGADPLPDKLDLWKRAAATYATEEVQESIPDFGYYAPNTDDTFARPKKPRDKHEPHPDDPIFGNWYFDFRDQSTEAKKAYRKAILAMHPDRSTGPDDLERRTRFAQVANSEGVYNNVQRLEELLRSFKAGDAEPPRFGAQRGEPRPRPRRPGRRPEPEPEPRRRPEPEPEPPEDPPDFRAARSVDTEPVKLKLDLPELIAFAKEISGGLVPKIRIKISKIPGVAGRFIPRTGEILIQASAAKDIKFLAEVVGHEIGHLLDWLPDRFLSRGNILGRLASLRNYTKTLLDEVAADPSQVLTDRERSNLRTAAERDVRQRFGFDGRARAAEWKTWKRENPERLREWRRYYYQQRVQAELDSRGLVDLNTILDELWELTSTWRPIPLNASNDYLNYRRRPSELYADAFSVLVNDPALLKALAPTFHSVFFNYLNRKPEAYAAYHSYQLLAQASEEEKLDRRNANRIRQQAEAAERRIVKGKKAWEKIKDGAVAFVNAFFDQVIDENSAIYKLAKRAAKLDPNFIDDLNPLHYIERIRRTNSMGSYYMHQFRDGVYDILKNAGVDMNAFAALLGLERAATERAEMANPWGEQGELAAAARDRLLEKHTPEQVDAIVLAVQHWWKLRQEVLNYAAESGLFTPETREKVMNNPLYVRFQVERFIDDTGGTYGPTNFIKRQIGTFEAIGNTVLETMLIDMALYHAAVKNRVGARTAWLYENYEPASIRRLRPREKGRVKADEAIVEYMEDGRRRRVVLPARAANWNSQSLYELNAVYDAILTVHGLFRRALIDYSIPWAIWNVNRDLKAMQKQVVRGDPVSSYLKTRHYALMSLPEVVRWVTRDTAVEGLADRLLSAVGARGRRGASEDILELLKEGSLVQHGTRLWEAADVAAHDPFRLIMAERGVQPGGLERGGWRKAWAAFDRGLTMFGEIMEKNTKLAGYKYLKANQSKLGLSDEQIHHEVRALVGTPDVMRRGKSHTILNSLFLFSGVAKEGYRSAYEVARARPVEYIVKTFAYSIWPKLIMAGLALGWFDGDDDDSKWSRLMQYPSEYMLTNYTIIPVGMINGRMIYVPIPQDHVGQLVGAATWKLIMGASDEDPEHDSVASAVFDTVMDNLPWGFSQVHPALQMVRHASQVFSGENPYDDYRNRSVVPKTTWAQGGKAARNAWLKHEWNAMLGNFYRFETREKVGDDRSMLERAPEWPFVGPVLNRLYRVSDYGITQKLFADLREMDNEGLAKEAVRDAWIVENLQNHPHATDAERWSMIQDDAAADLVVPHQRRRDFLKRVDNLRKRQTAGENPYSIVSTYANTEEKRERLRQRYKELTGQDPPSEEEEAALGRTAPETSYPMPRVNPKR